MFRVAKSSVLTVKGARRLLATLSAKNISMKPVLLAFYNNGQCGVSHLESKYEVVNLWDDSNSNGLVNGSQDQIDANKEKVTAILCTMMHDINADLIKSLPNLEIIATFSVGFNHIDLQARALRLPIHQMC